MDNKLFQALKAWHGGAADFERFLDEYINSGEGAQVYGVGHYTAEKRGTAEWYRDTVTRKHNRNSNFAINGVPLKKLGRTMDAADAGDNPDEVDALIDEMQLGHLNRRQVDLLITVANNADLDKTSMDEAHRGMYDAHSMALSMAKGHGRKRHQGMVDDLEAIRDDIKRVKSERKDGRLYELRITTAPEHLIDWDEPLSKQHPEVIEKARALPEIAEMLEREEANRQHHLKEGKATADLFEPNGESLYWQLADRDMEANDQREAQFNASKKLLAAGIHGIRYRDQGSRGKKVPAQLFVDGKPVEAWNGTNPQHIAQELNPDFTLPANIQFGLEADGRSHETVDELINHHKDAAEKRGRLLNRAFDYSSGEKPRTSWHDDAVEWLTANKDRVSIVPGRPTYNYVMFDPDLIHIVRKYNMKGDLLWQHPTFKEVDHDPFAGEK